LPVDLHTFFSPLFGPRLEHLLGGWFARTCDEFHALPQWSLLHPTLAFLFAPIAGVQPQVLEARELLVCVSQELFYPLLI
jgi:hypothetical protein